MSSKGSENGTAAFRVSLKSISSLLPEGPRSSAGKGTGREAVPGPEKLLEAHNTRRGIHLLNVEPHLDTEVRLKGKVIKEETRPCSRGAPI